MSDEVNWNSIKVFSATMAGDRETLGERVGAWIREKTVMKPACTASCDNDPCSCGAWDSFRVEEILVRQSSDRAFHCVALIVFYWETPKTVIAARRLNFK